MNRRLTKDEELEIYKECLRGKSQIETAKRFDISQGYVSQIYHRTIKRNDEKLAVSAALEFVAEYTKQYDYLNMKLQELEVLLTQADNVKDKNKIIMDQVAVTQIILNHCSQGKFMQAVQEYGYGLQQEKQKELE